MDRSSEEDDLQNASDDCPMTEVFFLSTFLKG
jgi:hypothetical protein